MLGLCPLEKIKGVIHTEMSFTQPHKADDKMSKLLFNILRQVVVFYIAELKKDYNKKGFAFSYLDSNPAQFSPRATSQNS